MSFDGDPLGFFGKKIVETHDALLLDRLKGQLPQSEKGTVSPDLLAIHDDKLALLVKKKVGILGAGIGGLYAALMLESVGVEYEILEASHRVGGRLETHKFKGGKRYDYYDAGAMRYPLPKKDEHGKYKNGIMGRLADLIDYQELNPGSNNLRDKLIPYYFTARQEKPEDRPGFYYFNGVHQSVGGKKDASGFKAKAMGVGDAYLKAGYDKIQEDVVGPFVRGLINDLETGSTDGWGLMLENDAYSVRGYMATKYLPSNSLGLPPKPLPLNVVNWLNLVETGTSRYDRAFSETVIEEMEFANVGGTDYGDVDWKCFDGGSETLSKAIAEYLGLKNESYVQFNHKVTAVEQVVTNYNVSSDYLGDEIPDEAITFERDGELYVGKHSKIGKEEVTKVPYTTIKVTSSDAQAKTHEHEYDHVISTLPLPVLRTIDLDNAGLNILQKNALRALDYGFSVKVAIRFKSPWWTEKLNITGGQSFTDLPIRTIVYPSYGVDSCSPSTVLIASYSWSSDASRLGALATKPDKADLKDLVLHNLAKAHKGVNGSNEITYEFLKGQLADVKGDEENFHVKDWNNDEYTMGAFANFSPGEFGDLYTSLTIPAANGCVHFAGEALSTRHRWVVGALDSAWRAVDEYLRVTKQRAKWNRFKLLWKGNSEWTAGSTVVDDKAGSNLDLIDQHVALVQNAILAGVV